MRLLVIADDDAFAKTLRNIPADVLISCGDLADDVILRTAEAANCFRIVGVKGDRDSDAAFPTPIIDLHLRTEEIGGLIFGGFRGAWKHGGAGHYLYNDKEVAGWMAEFPPVDVFVAHNSPRNVHDRDDGVHLGFSAFAEYIRRHQPRLFIHGHQDVNNGTPVGNTRVIGIHGLQRFQLPVKVKVR